MFLWHLIFIAVLVALNAFFVGVEFAAVSSRRSRIEVLAEGGDAAAVLVKAWLENPAARDRLIAAAQLGITIVSLALGAVGENAFEAALAPFFHGVSLPPEVRWLGPAIKVLPLVLSLLVVTSIHVVLGEQVPKVAALHDPERVALLAARPMRAFSTTFRWLIGGLDAATRVILAGFGIRMVGEHQMLYTVEELKKIVADSEAGGVIEQPEREMLHAVFEFGELLVRHIMTPRAAIVGIEADTPLHEVADTVSQSLYTKFPVYEDNLDQIIGVLHVKDMLRVINDPERRGSVARDLTREALFVPETIRVGDLLRQFRDRRQHVAFALDEYGGTAGLVTLEDLLEEIVGEVSDPFDRPKESIQALPDGTSLIDGRTPIDDVNKSFGLELEDPSSDTIAGLVLSRLGRIAQRGDHVEVDDPSGASVSLRVESTEGLRIARVALRRVERRAAE